MSEEKAQEVVVHVHIDQTDLDEVVRKIERIHNLTKEANSLAGELASQKIELLVEIKD